MLPRRDVHKLTDIPNIGKALGVLFTRGGIVEPADFIGKDPYALFDDLCGTIGQKLDPCVLDTVMAAVDYMNGGEAKKWWEFTAERKRRLKK